MTTTLFSGAQQVALTTKPAIHYPSSYQRTLQQVLGRISAEVGAPVDIVSAQMSDSYQPAVIGFTNQQGQTVSGNVFTVACDGQAMFWIALDFGRLTILDVAPTAAPALIQGGEPC